MTRCLAWIRTSSATWPKPMIPFPGTESDQPRRGVSAVPRDGQSALGPYQIIPEATGADIEHLGLERGHRTLVITRKGSKVVTIPLAPRTARAMSWRAHRGASLPRWRRATAGPAWRRPGCCCATSGRGTDRTGRSGAGGYALFGFQMPNRLPCGSTRCANSIWPLSTSGTATVAPSSWALSSAAWTLSTWT